MSLDRRLYSICIPAGSNHSFIPSAIDPKSLNDFGNFQSHMADGQIVVGSANIWRIVTDLIILSRVLIKPVGSVNTSPGNAISGT